MITLYKHKNKISLVFIILPGVDREVLEAKFRAREKTVTSIDFMFTAFFSVARLHLWYLTLIPELKILG